jgi:hypothetical protein
MSVRGSLGFAVTSLAGAAVSVVFASSAFGVGARVAAAASPPTAGAWKIVANHSQPGPSINEFDGSFTVSGGKVAKLTGITQRRVNSGCIARERVTMLDSTAIRHFLDQSIASDYYYVGKVNGFAKVALTFQGAPGTKDARTVHSGTGQLRIFFPGGTDTRGGFTGYSNLTYESSSAGICNLEFSVKTS